jgi:two-component system sensor histidine kinase KdpD
MSMSSIHAWSASRRYLLGAGSVLLATAVLATFFSSLHQVNLVLVYLLVVLINATTIGRGPAILASVLAFMGFNFFFVQPLHSFSVTDPQDVLRLLTFLVVAVIGSSLAGRAREQADTAARSASELAALYGLSQTISAEVDLERILPLVAQTTVQLLNVPACSLLLYDAGGRLVERAAAGEPPQQPSRRVDAFLRSGRLVLGVLRVTSRARDGDLTAAERERLDTIASQAVLVLERARLVEEVSQARAQAESERMKSALLSSVSHDLRTPLAVIKGAVTSLLDDTVPWQSEARRDLLCAVDDEADRLNRLVGNLLDMSRIESGALHPARNWQDLGTLAEEVVDRMRPQLANHPLAIEVAVDLPLVRASYMQIDQVLTNLIENAAKYTPDGAPIGVRCYQEGENLRVEVRDQGAGVPPEMLTQIFEKFVRATGPERHAHGTGLGLAICKGIVEAHGGSIWAENQAGGGARFIFTLPLPAQPAPTLPIQAHNANTFDADTGAWP